MLEIVEKATTQALRLYAATFPQRRRIHLLSEASVHTGWEGTVFSLQLGYEEDSCDYSEHVILKYYYGKVGQQKGYTEWLALRQLSQYYYPVPRALSTSFELTPLEQQACVLMEGIQGQSMGHLFLSSPRPEQLTLIQQFCQLHAQLHTVDWRICVPDPDDYNTVDFLPLRLTEERLIVEQSLPHIFGPAFDWLHEKCSRIATLYLALMHGDFHLGNILLRPDGSPVVIDWTGFDVSDYRLDLARTLLIAYLNLPAGWMEVIRASYAKARGQDSEHLEYFEVLACISRLANMLITLKHGGPTLGMSPETMKQYVGQTWKLSLFLQERIIHPLPALEDEIAYVNEKCATHP